MVLSLRTFRLAVTDCFVIRHPSTMTLIQAIPKHQLPLLLRHLLICPFHIQFAHRLANPLLLPSNMSISIPSPTPMLKFTGITIGAGH